jgi:hypothetical protein
MLPLTIQSTLTPSCANMFIQEILVDLEALHEVIFIEKV